jgi:tetratricopeptide (TPR) repeat protein
MKKIIPFLMLAVIFGLFYSNAKAESPYNTWAWGPGGSLVRTQDAYTPMAEIDLPISGAEDMFVTSNGSIYIADTGHGKILKLQDFEVVATYGEGDLASPTGLFVDAEGNLYVADAKKNEVLIFDRDGNKLKEFGRPVEPLFGKDKEFLPRKIVVDERKNIYIVSEGSANGIVQLNSNGNFIGYFGANTASMSLKMILQRTFLTKKQLAQFVKNEAASPSNIDIDNQGLIYTVTAGTAYYKSIRKYTISGKNIFRDTFGSVTFRDIHTSDSGLVIAVDSDGVIYEYDLTGILLFVFGAKDTGEQRLGTLSNPTAIDRYQDYLFVLDKDKNAIVSYQTTAFARLVHDGTHLYMDGYYTEAKPYFENVLNYNGSFIISYDAIADAYFKEGNYTAALANYRYAEDRAGYSQAFWELRNVILQKYLSGAILGLLGLWMAVAIFNRLERRYKWLDPIRMWLDRLQKIRLIDDFVFMFRFIKHPADSFYYIKKNLRGSLVFAGLLYAWVILARILSLYFTGFIFNPYARTSDIRFENEVVYTLLLMLLWNAANYLVSTISDGEGRVRDVIIGSAYSLFPYAIFALPIAAISNVLSQNEVFLYSFSTQLMMLWIGIMLFIMVNEVHNYTFSETVRNVLVTIFTMALFVLTGYILMVLFTQLSDFISAIVQEAGLRG